MELLTWDMKELDRISVIRQILEGKITQAMAGTKLGLSERQIRRLLTAYKQLGPEGLRSKRRGRPSNNRLSDTAKQEVCRHLTMSYRDFGPTLAQEKLQERHSLVLSVESVRQLMIELGLWKPKRRRKPRIHQTRNRRPTYGELIQIDGSPHDWFEGRAPKCCLLGFIDDATSTVQHLQFVEAETTEAYLRALEAYILLHGRPKAFYSDKHGVFRINSKGEGFKGDGTTQFSRTLKELEIDLICANSPQAKGRIERLFNTLQDRLIKEMRLNGIDSIDAANEYLPKFIGNYNAKFAVPASEPGDSHDPLRSSMKLEEIICLKDSRTLTKNLELSYEGDLYQVITERPTYALRGARVEVRRPLGGVPAFYYKGKKLEVRKLMTRDSHGRISDRKNLVVAARPPRGANGRLTA